MNTYFLISGIITAAFVVTTIVLAIVAYKNRDLL